MSSHIICSTRSSLFFSQERTRETFQKLKEESSAKVRFFRFFFCIAVSRGHSWHGGSLKWEYPNRFHGSFHHPIPAIWGTDIWRNRHINDGGRWRMNQWKMGIQSDITRTTWWFIPRQKWDYLWEQSDLSIQWLWGSFWSYSEFPNHIIVMRTGNFASPKLGCHPAQIVKPMDSHR